ncbi:MAG: CehA/McbA family metallohydrolase, partial [Butyrivibrio sp.]|nr:CehA/McbA family metallohydrolase [Butyrivibrio sp.]
TVEPKEDGTIETKDTNALVLTVSKNADGFYTLKTDDGKYLGAEVQVKEKPDGKKSTYCNYILSDTLTEDCVWTQEAADDKNAGNFWMINNHAKNGSYNLAFEYYDSKIAVYGINKTKPEYVFNFYALKEGKKSSVDLEYDNETSLTIAQWGGNAHYNEFDECEEYVNGDLYAINDMLDSDSKFTAVVNGENVQPWSSGTSTKTKTTSYYMGAKGVSDSGDYMQFETSSLGYANAKISFRLRASNTGAGALQLKYSTDGEEFKNMSKGTYSYKYTAYGKKVKNPDGTETQNSWEKSGDGDISDGIAKTSFAPANYVTFSFDIPASANNSEKLYIRLVPTGDKNAKGNDAPGDSGVIRVDSVMITGNPAISDDTCRIVTATPTSGPVEIGQAVELGCATEGAEIYYKLNKDDDFVKYEVDTKIELSELPAAITAYAKKDGLSNSAKVIYQYTQAQVETVMANPNGGSVFQGQFLTLKTKTEGATILYRYRTAEEIAADEKQQTNTPSTEQSSSEDENEDEEGTEGELDESSENEIHDDWKIASGSIALENLPCQIQVKAVKEGYKDSAVKTLKFTKKLNEKYGIYFGQIHAHTNISDGAGSLEEALEHASKVDNLDYIIITDHSNSIDNEKESKITENVDKSEDDEWTYAHNLVKKYSTDDFTCAYGYEMTWSNGLGHMNTYNTPGFQSRTQTEYSTYSTALNNYYQTLRTVPDSINQFNHPGTTFGDFQDFAYYSEENDALITMIEVGNGEGTIGSAGYFPSYEYYTRALDKGWHVAPTNNQDNHKGKWGDANTARTVVLADVNNEDNIYDAMRNCRIYATEDNDLSIYYTLEGNIMGSVLDKEDVGDHLAIKADITDPTDSEIGKVEVIVNGGQSIENVYVDKNSETVEFTVPAHYSYYYLKITEKDGDIAVTAPVWVGDVEACGINKTYTNTVLPVAGEELDVNVDFYNNESKTLEINSIEVQLSDVDQNKTSVVSMTGEEAGVASVSPNGTATFKTEFVYEKAGQVTYEVKVNATLNGVAKVYTDKLTVSYAVPEMVSDVTIDGTHYGDYVTGYYGGNVNAFVSLCADKTIRATVVTDKITADTLKDSKFLVVSAPAKKTDSGKGYTVSHYEDEFLEVVKNYVAEGGSVIVCGLADYSDSTDCQTATEQNKLLEAIGATIRMGSDEVADDKNNGGQVYRMYPNTFNLESDLFAGIKDGQVYSQYSGCSVDISNATANDVVDAAEWLVKGFDTTYSVDCKDSEGKGYGKDVVLPNGLKGKENNNVGNVTFLARQKTKFGGQIIVAGGVFLSDFEVKVEMDNNDTLPYANATIVKNLLEGATVELATTSIADARKGQMNDVFAVEGYVTSGTVSKDTTFFDTIYIQDETGGMDIFPYANSGLKLGTKVRVVGYLAQYQGDIELKIMSCKILDDEPKVIEPKTVSTKEAMDYKKLGGQL